MAVSSAARRRSTAERTIVRLRRGMYAPADIYQACDDSGKHLLHARAALAAQQGPVALTGASAAALHGFALYHQDLSIVHILRLDQGASRRKALTNHHIVIQDLDSELGQYDGILAVSPARAVWEVACRSTMEAGVVTADSALRKAPELAKEVEELQERFAYFPGSRQGRITIGSPTDGPTRLVSQSLVCSSIVTGSPFPSFSTMSLMIKVICSEPPTSIGSNTVISASSMARSNTRSCCGLARLHQTESSARNAAKTQCEPTFVA